MNKEIRDTTLSKRGKEEAILVRDCAQEGKAHILYPCLHTEPKQAWSDPTLSLSYLINNGFSNSFILTNTTFNPDYLCFID